jgi:hypothetical protein
MGALIDSQEFIESLESRGLVIVSLKELRRLMVIDVDYERQKLLEKKALTVSEIIKHRLLRVTSKTSIYRMIESKKIKKHEYYTENGKLYINTEAIKRLAS